MALREGKGGKKRRWEEGKGDSQYTTALLGEMGKGRNKIITRTFEKSHKKA